jgi:hypothetical protein
MVESGSFAIDAGAGGAPLRLVIGIDLVGTDEHAGIRLPAEADRSSALDPSVDRSKHRPSSLAGHSQLAAGMDAREGEDPIFGASAVPTARLRRRPPQKPRKYVAVRLV